MALSQQDFSHLGACRVFVVSFAVAAGMVGARRGAQILQQGQTVLAAEIHELDVFHLRVEVYTWKLR